MDNSRWRNSIMAILTKTEGYFIINNGAISLSESTSVSYRDDATIQEFDTEELMLAAHEEQFPDQYTYSKGIDEVDQEPYLHDSDEL